MSREADPLTALVSRLRAASRQRLVRFASSAIELSANSGRSFSGVIVEKLHAPYVSVLAGQVEALVIVLCPSSGGPASIATAGNLIRQRSWSQRRGWP